MKILCITGQKRSGKDTALDFIAKNHNVIYYKLAHEIKSAIVYGFLDEYTYEDIDGKTEVDREEILNVNQSEINCYFNNAVNYLIDIGLNVPLSKKGLTEFINSYPINSWSIRTFMQRLGTDFVCNKCDELFWVRLAIKNYADNLNPEVEYFIIPDVRQDWEIDSIRKLGGVIVHVKRDSINKNVSIDNHSTERVLPIKSGDIIINNNSSLEEFYNTISKYI